jgi:uncharacterized circularly permuted ATP-grasp superfamily protein/uncharacterized alpha-E superfamily protein
MTRLGTRELGRRWRMAQQLIRANGVTYNVYGDPLGAERLWAMDPLPLIISERDWAHLEAGVVQRATLLNAILGDLYGGRELIRSGALPAPLLFANSGLLRPCQGVKVPGNVWLHCYAADVARSPDGQWWVVGDRAQAPSGSGYALENRLVSAQTLNSVFNQCAVRPLARWFEARRDGLQSLAAEGRMVLLTPGPYNETYFEHSYLSKYLGITLVEGADLTVRDNALFLKTLVGLERVGLVLRCQDDAYCDPLELRGDSLLGVPGLMAAVRAGHVVVANALGSGLVESAGLKPFLPGMCWQLLGEPLRLPSVATWWCGQAAERGYVIDHLDQLVVKPAFPRFGLRPSFGPELSTGDRERLAEQIRSQPEAYVAQEMVELSTAPVWEEGRLTPRHVIVRLYAAWDGQGYRVMPGGLTRVSRSASSVVVTIQQGGGSKDTWVLGATEAPQASKTRPPYETAKADPAAARSGADLPSRVADNLFWLGRYTERVEAIARLLRGLLPALSGEEDFGQRAGLDTALAVLAEYQLVSRNVLDNSIAGQRRQLEQAMRSMVYDPARVSSLGWNLKQIRRVAWPLKQRLSSDSWRVLQDLEMTVLAAPPADLAQRPAAAMALLDQIVVSLSAFAGLQADSTTRGAAWRFLDCGRRLERCLQTVELLRNVLGHEAGSASSLELVLQVADSSITYRNRYFTQLRTDLVLDVLMLDTTNPRAIGFQIAALAEHIGNLPGQPAAAESSAEGRLIDETIKYLEDVRLEELAGANFFGELSRLMRFLATLRGMLWNVSETLTARYLVHIAPSRLTPS